MSLILVKLMNLMISMVVLFNCKWPLELSLALVVQRIDFFRILVSSNVCVGLQRIERDGCEMIERISRFDDYLGLAPRAYPRLQTPEKIIVQGNGSRRIAISRYFIDSYAKPGLLWTPLPPSLCTLGVESAYTELVNCNKYR